MIWIGLSCRFLQEIKNSGGKNCSSGNKGTVYLVYGVLVLYERSVRELLDMRIFVDVDSDTRLSRRVQGLDSTKESLEAALNHYLKFSKQSFEEFILPTKKYSDVIIPRGSENCIAIDLIVDHVKELIMSSKGRQQAKFLSNLATFPSEGTLLLN